MREQQHRAMTTRRKTSSRKKDDGPWEHENPRHAAGKPSKALSPSQKASAKRHAKAAGRPYPNLVDNMQAAQRARGKAK